MIEQTWLNKYLDAYKRDFTELVWPGEKYKWQAVKHFQDNWDVQTNDFTTMLETSLSKTDNLLVSAGNFPLVMIKRFSKSDPERVRAMFIALFNEDVEIFERIDAFKQESAQLLEIDGAGSHYQNENTISTYLWLRYPNKYYIYKWSEARRVSERLRAGYRFKQGEFALNIRDHFEMYNQICGVLQADKDLRGLLDSQLSDDCYPDPVLKTMTIDVAFYISRYVIEEAFDQSWWPSIEEYEPGLSIEDWESLLRDNSVFDAGSLEVMKRLKDIGGQASCQTLASKYGRGHRFYNGTSSALAKRVTTASGCPAPKDLGDYAKWCPVLYTGRDATKDEEGTFVWRLRDELSRALDRVDLSGIKLYADEVSEPRGEALETNLEVTPTHYASYTKDDFLSEVYMSEPQYDPLVAVLKRKKNIILQGAPGVGKTFAAERLAWSIMGEKDADRVEFVQFHQNYSYEDFVMGYKPTGDSGFILKDGIFYTFCKEAANEPNRDFFFIIDEINRGNMSKIFGELLMLIEADYRGKHATLAYSGVPFAVPANVYIIGMMNTADRSLAMIDYALRRRFSFITMEPGFTTDGFTKYQNSLDDNAFDRLILAVQELNKQIVTDPSLGSGFCIGHSYFCGQVQVSADWLDAVVDYDILPMLEEYWFDDQPKVAEWDRRLHEALQL